MRKAWSRLRRNLAFEAFFTIGGLAAGLAILFTGTMMAGRLIPDGYTVSIVRTVLVAAIFTVAAVLGPALAFVGAVGYIVYCFAVERWLSQTR